MIKSGVEVSPMAKTINNEKDVDLKNESKKVGSDFIDERISIELLDGSPQEQSLKFWESEYIYENNKHNEVCNKAIILEKNLFAADAKIYPHFSDLEEIIVNNLQIINYSLFLYNNLINSGKINIYRKIDNKLYLVGEIGGSCLGYINSRLNEGKKKFDEILED